VLYKIKSAATAAAHWLLGLLSKLLLRPGKKLLDIFSQCGVPSVSADVGDDFLTCRCELVKPAPPLGVHQKERPRRCGFQSSALAVPVEKFGDLGSRAFAVALEKFGYAAAPVFSTTT
jgi:hypothetical protein